MPNKLQGDPAPALAKWFEDHGATALKELTRATDISPPTLRKAYRGIPIRADVALKLAEVVGCDHKLFTEPPERPKASKRKRKRVAAA